MGAEWGLPLLQLRQQHWERMAEGSEAQVLLESEPWPGG